MRTEEIYIYKYEELSDSAKEKAREWFLSGNEYPWAEETRESLEKFCKAFDITLEDWSYGGNNYYVKADLNIDYHEEELQGIRLYKFIVNNWDTSFREEARKYPYFSTKDRAFRKPKEYTTKSGKKRVSRITFVDADCPFTGYCMDDALMRPIHDFIKNPGKFKNWTLEDLLNDCLEEWLKSARADYEHCQSAEYAEESIIANEYEFTADGTVY